MSSERTRRRAVAVAVAAMLLSSAFPATDASAVTPAEAAEQAARAILDARDRANAAAEAMFAAESRLDVLDVELAAAEEELAALESEVGELRSGLAETAIRRYVGSGQNPLMLFQEVGRGNDQQSALVYTGAATGSQLVQTDNYEEAIRELGEARDDLERRRSDAAAARDEWERAIEAAEAEIVELEQLEAELLAEAAVQAELERQRQIRVAQERAEREAERRQEAERQAERQAALADAPRPQAASAPADRVADDEPAGDEPAGDEPADDGGSSTGSDTADTQAPEPEPEPEPEAPATTAPPVTPEPASNAGSGMVCPVAGTHSFADTWGAPRSGGRRHEGVDMIAPSGTPLVAAESGSANFKQTPLGGNSVWLTGASGTKYFYAHLSSFAGSSRGVSQGEVIGYVGSTGNTSVPHLHLQIHPGGGQAVNPYPYVRAVC